jgi:hypothetical protein
MLAADTVGPLHAGQVWLHARKYTPARTHTQICNTAFRQPQWFRERVSMLRYTYIACVVLHVSYPEKGTCVGDVIRGISATPHFRILAFHVVFVRQAAY